MYANQKRFEYGILNRFLSVSLRKGKFLTKDEVIAQAEEMRQSKITSLERQIENVKQIKFGIKDE